MPGPLIVVLVLAVFVGGCKLLTLVLNRWTAKRQASVDAWQTRAVTELGLLPEERQNTKRSTADPELEALRAAAEAGDWQHCAERLAATGRDWGRRFQLVAELADAAAEEDAWLKAWRAERPGDPDAAAVHADALVKLAWNLRGAARAKKTSREQFDAFHKVLAEAHEACAEAQRLAPQDPTPWIPEIWIALGLGYPAEEFARVWEGITSRDPYNYPAHYAALQYWCGKWRGSEQQAWEFADKAAGSAPEDSLLAGLRLVALFEHEPDSDEDAYYSTPQARAAVDAVLRAVDAAPAGHPRVAENRHLLAWCLTLTDRPVEALEQFRLVDGYVDALPWRYSDDPAAYFCRIRAVAADFAHRQSAA